MPLSSPSGSGSASGLVAGTVINTVPKFEPQSTNLCLWSQAFDNGAWTGTAVVTPDSTVAPDGTLTADTLNDNTGALLDKAQAVAIANDGLPYVASCYFLAGSSADSRIDFTLSGGTPVTGYIEFNPASGAIIAGSGTAYSVAAFQIGAQTWLRAQVTVINNNSGNTTGTISIKPAAASVGATGTVIAWGVNVEKQLAATGYIPTAGAAVTRPAGKIAPWLLNVAETILAKVTTYAVDAISDSGKLITGSGTFNVSLPAAASAGNGFWFEVRNIGTGTLSLVANGAEKIYLPGDIVAGNSTVTLPYSGSLTGPYNVSGLRLACDGVAWYATSTCETHGVQRFTSNGTWTAPQGVTAAWVTAIGGGGNGGAGDNVTLSGAGGGAGTTASRVLVAVVPGTGYAVTIGAAGGTTSLGALVSCAGGSNGSAGSAGGQFGGQAGMSTGSLAGGSGGSSFMGGAGASGYNAEAGSAAAANSGAGGGGGGTNGSGGPGGTGILIVEW